MNDRAWVSMECLELESSVGEMREMDDVLVVLHQESRITFNPQINTYSLEHVRQEKNYKEILKCSHSSCDENMIIYSSCCVASKLTRPRMDIAPFTTCT